MRKGFHPTKDHGSKFKKSGGGHLHSPKIEKMVLSFEKERCKLPKYPQYVLYMERKESLAD